MIVITGHGEKEVAVKALRQGASDYLEKPFDLDELSHAVQRCLREYQARDAKTRTWSPASKRACRRVEGKAEDKFWYVSKAPAMAKVNEWLTVLRREAMRGDAEEPAVLILGESGTGKEGIARMVHAGSRRGKGPWVAVNCANFNEQLLESELFGHEKGAFTGATATKRGLFEIAKGGTLFLDEIGEMDVKLQAKLLRVLQEKVFRRVGGTADIESDVRVVAATNRNLQQSVQDGQVPRGSLSSPEPRRGGDSGASRAQRRYRPDGQAVRRTRVPRAGQRPSVASLPKRKPTLRNYAWPGNVRELLNVIERTALVWHGTGTVTSSDLSISSGERSGRHDRTAGRQFDVVNGGGESSDGYTELKKRWSDSFEREYLIGSLQRHGGNVSAAAREARLDRSNFLRLLRRHSLKAQDYRKTQPGEMPAVASTADTTTKAA